MNSRSWIIRSAKPTDAVSIVSIIREAFPARLLDATVYGCPGIGKYIVEQIIAQDGGGDAHYTVAEKDGEIGACAEIRRLPDRLFLNYIAVLASYRSLGLGKRLLRRALAANDRNAEKAIALDVFDYNANVLNWYERLGFERQSVTVWREGPLNGGTASSAIISGYAQAEACQREFGFSKFRIQAGKRAYEIGRLGDHWYRLTNVEALRVPGLVARLKNLEPHRRILVLSDAAANNMSLNLREIAKTYRLTAAGKIVHDRLPDFQNINAS
ncbi:MAG: GNAT family N-acetyltransferase [Pirellulales bacterium]|nr:GNAT family N-acetyltransferase [Pirellulales bacterium]